MQKKLNDLGQLKIQQMAFMLVAVTIFFVLAGMFILVIKFSGLKDLATELEERNALLLVTKLANSPEFSCGESFGANKINCVDSDKLMVLRENADRYEGFWGVSNVEIRKIYPKTSSGDVECNLGNYPECDIIKILDKEISAEHSKFVSLCRKEKDAPTGEVYNKCEVARIMVSYGGE